MIQDRREQPFLAELIYFTNAQVVVEVGVCHGHTSLFLCQALRRTGGHLYGYDVWSKHGQQNQFGQTGSKAIVEELLQKHKLDNYTMTRIDTINNREGFSSTLLKHCPTGIDLAFIDGDHSYRGICNDFSVVYPFMRPNGIIAFHDTLRIDGCREFVLDLRTKFNDGTFDVVDFPWGQKDWNCGVTLLVKRAYPTSDLGIQETCGSPSQPSEIETREKEWYGEEVKTHQGAMDSMNPDVPMVYLWRGRNYSRNKFDKLGES